MQLQIFLIILIIILVLHKFYNRNQLEGFSTKRHRTELGEDMPTICGECTNPYVGRHSVEGKLHVPVRRSVIKDGKRNGFDLTNIPGIQMKLMRDADPYPYNESSPKEVQWLFPRGVRRKHHLKSRMVETRNPGLIAHRYDYDDQRACYVNEPPVLKDKARLKELPVQLRNWYHARVPTQVTKYDDYYQPSHIVGKKYKGECRRFNAPYFSSKTVAPILTDPTPLMSIRANNPMVDEVPFDHARRANMIQARNPSDTLPAQYADRSKTSVEKIMAAQNIKDNYSEPIYGWLPHEY